MAKNWQVVVVTGEARVASVYGAEYFPRSFHYKKDAEKLSETLTELGAVAKVERVVKQKDAATHP